MNLRNNNSTSSYAKRRRRRGLTLTELLIASTVMTMIAGGMGMLVMTVHATNEYCRGQSLAAQHARVATDRIERTIRGATASDDFPGCLVVSTTVGTWQFPDALVVWNPDGTPVDRNGLPRVKELSVFATDPNAPNRLMEIRAPANNAIVPAATDTSGWLNLVQTLRTSISAERTELTDRLRTASVEAGMSTNVRGCVRFHLLMGPTIEEWEDYRADTLEWSELSWPLDLYSSRKGMRRVVCQYELQLLPGDSESGQPALPFFGSAVLSYELTR